jgi:hypothetical protein
MRIGATATAVCLARLKTAAGSQVPNVARGASAGRRIPDFASALDRGDRECTSPVGVPHSAGLRQSAAARINTAEYPIKPGKGIPNCVPYGHGQALARHFLHDPTKLGRLMAKRGFRSRR